jgi:hypothetical protein
MKSRGVEVKPKIAFPFMAVLVSLAAIASGQVIVKQSASEAFSELLRWRPAASSNLNIKLTVEDTHAVVREMLLTNGKTKVLSLPVAIENDSPTAITTSLAHEWYGGIWPPTDLYVAVRKESLEDRYGSRDRDTGLVKKVRLIVRRKSKMVRRCLLRSA